MSYLMAIFMGLIQGVAEFLPISSSGHLALFQTFFGMEDVEETHMFFTILLHFGTLLSVCVVYWQDVIDMIREFFLGVASLFSRRRGRGGPPPARRQVLLIVVATLPLFVMVLVKEPLEKLFSNSIMVSIALIITGFILFFGDRMARGHKNARTATVADALVVGCAQAVAILPGISRSGTSISAGLVRGFDRSFAVRFSFLMSLPAVLGATLLELIGAVKDGGVDTTYMPQYLVGVAVAAVVGFFAINLVKALSKKGQFGNFCYYCWVVGLGSLVAGIVVK